MTHILNCAVPAAAQGCPAMRDLDTIESELRPLNLRFTWLQRRYVETAAGTESIVE